MANTESKQQYEGAILQQLIKNSERLVIVKDISQLKQDMAFIKLKVESIDRTLETVKWILVTIALAIVANIFSQPITSYLFS